jgi:phosphoglycerate dehydrogenase-like enzyme
LDTYGAEWREVAPELEYLVLPNDRHLEQSEIDTIGLAVFSADVWRDQRGPSFMKVLLQAPNVQWLHMFAAGLDNPVFGMLGERGLTITHSAGSSATPIAHTVIMQVIAMCRDARPLAIAQSNKEWASRATVDVEGRRMAVVGLGAIGGEVARLATHFGIEVIGLRRTPTGDEPCPTWPIHRLHELLPTVDDLVLTAPLNADTRGLIGATELGMLRPGAHVVNVGRGELVDEEALVEALRTGQIGGAALDVFAVEPLPHDSPLWGMANVIITPHSAGTTPLATRRAADIFVDNLIRFIGGEPLRNVGFSRGRLANSARMNDAVGRKSD